MNRIAAAIAWVAASISFLASSTGHGYGASDAFMGVGVLFVLAGAGMLIVPEKKA